jgi:small subunit ribosomal protein S8
MNIQDPISDMLTRLRNAAMRHSNLGYKKSQAAVTVKVPHSKIKEAILKVMESEGYIKSYSIEQNNDRKNNPTKQNLLVELKFHEGKHVISQMKAVSKPSKRVYKSSKDLPYFKSGLGVVLVSTSKGVMTAKKARNLEGRGKGYGGEVLLEIF